jgi:hypothetical protein
MAVRTALHSLSTSAASPCGDSAMSATPAGKLLGPGMLALASQAS